MKEFEAAIKIKASPEAVWSVLVDTATWPDWDPSCERIEGTIALGEKLKAFSTLSPGRAFPVKVSELEHPKRMVWQGGMPLGLFKGVRTFALEETEDGGTMFSLREIFTGPMLPLIQSSLPDLKSAFEQFAAGLKDQVEAQPDSARPELTTAQL